jgi:peptide/nickel transport system substrate-binding protein
VTALVAFSLIAAACGGDDDDATPEETSSTEADEPADDTGDEPADDTGDEPADDTGDEPADDSGDDTGAPPTTVSPVSEEDDADGDAGPTRGGRLVYGIEADSANPWAPHRVSCAISCMLIMQAISDTLMAPAQDGTFVPNLLESMEPNEDYTVWTMTARDGITFHDGTPFDGAAIAFNINACRFSPLTGSALANIADVQADGQTVTVTMATPWAAYPASVAAAGTSASCSFMYSPTWLASLPDVPFRTEGAPYYSEEIAATPADGDPAAPVGLGPFEFVSYTPGNGNSFIAQRYEDYWRGPNGITGEELPYLDEVEFVVAVDIASRSAAVQSGQFDIMHTANADEIASLQDDDGLEGVVANDFGETGYVMLNVAEGVNPTIAFLQGLEEPPAMDPEGVNADSPLVHLSCRKALAHAIDRQRIADERGAGLVSPANGPFPPGAIGYLDDTGYPDFDLDAAQENFEQCQADAGTDTIQFTFNTTNDPFNVETNELVASMWEEAFGGAVQTSVTPVEQGQYIGLALTGDYQALSWRNHGGSDPDVQFLWWFSGAASPIGQLALNFGRFQDPVIDQNLLAQRQSPDPEVRREAVEAVNRAFGENVWNLWTTWTLWGVFHNPQVHNVTGQVAPGGEALRPIIAGRHFLPQVWCTDGNCQG